MKVQIEIFKCTGIMGQDLVHPYIQSTTVLCDKYAFMTAGNIFESHSSEFIVAFGKNVGTPTLSLFISTIEPDPVLVTVTTLRGFNFTGFATNNETLSIEIPNTFQVRSSSERDKGILVRAEDQRSIVVYGLNYYTFSSDAFLGLPCDRLPVDHYEYYGVAYSGGGVGESYFVIVGCEDGTMLQIGSDTIELNKMETYYWESNTVTGARIVSDKPLAVYIGHACTFIPSSNSACDHIIEQVPPTALWGTNFMSASYAGRNSGDLYRILASQDETTVNLKCNSLNTQITLNTAGSWHELTTPDDSFCYISSDKPLLVMQFGLGASLDGVGDPSMMMITPVEQYSNNYVFNVLPEFETNYITIYITPDDYQPQNIFVDNASLENSTWTTINCSNGDVCGYITFVTLTPGQHTLYHSAVSSSVGVSAYGFNSGNSYGYPGGLQLKPVQRKFLPYVSVHKNYCNIVTQHNILF